MRAKQQTIDIINQNIEDMEMTIYLQENEPNETLDSFLDIYFCSQMKYLASDLLKEELSPVDISNALRRAMMACQTAELNVREHFQPVYTQVGGMLCKDCKLSLFGYALMVLNANVKIPTVAKWQLNVLKEFVK